MKRSIHATLLTALVIFFAHSSVAKPIPIAEAIDLIDTPQSEYSSAIKTWHAKIELNWHESRRFTSLVVDIKQRLLEKSSDYGDDSYIEEYNKADLEAWAMPREERYRFDTTTLSRTFGGYEFPLQYIHSRQLIANDKYFNYDTHGVYGHGTKGLWIDSADKGIGSFENRGVLTDEFFRFKSYYPFPEYFKGYVKTQESLGKKSCEITAELLDTGDLVVRIVFGPPRNGEEEYRFNKSQEYLITHYVRKHPGSANDEYRTEWTKTVVDNRTICFPASTEWIRSEKFGDSIRETIRDKLVFHDVEINYPIPESVFSLDGLDINPRTTVLDRYSQMRNYPLSDVTLAGLMELAPAEIEDEKASELKPQEVKSSEERIAEAAIKSFQSAIWMFKSDASRAPTTGEGLDALLHKPEDLDLLHWGGPYLSSKRNVIPPDPWGNPYRYRVVDDKPVIDSAGPDGKFGTPDDIQGKIKP